jgi:DNA gyrase subunit A
MKRTIPPKKRVRKVGPIKSSVKVKDKIKEVFLEDKANSEYYIYGTSVIEDRAIFGSIDGLKPVMRRSLWSAHDLGLTSKVKADKSAKIVGWCFTKGTLVSTPEGDRVIEDLEIGDKVLTDIGVFKITRTYIMPPKPTATITLKNGSSVTATLDQIFYTVDEQGKEIEIKLSNIKPGLKIYCKK